MEKKEEKPIAKKSPGIPNQEILGGIRAAIARGSNLKDAMMSFYQAGYDKTEIEQAAKVYVELQKSPEEIIKKEDSKEKPKSKEKEDKKEEKKKEVVAKPLEKKEEKKKEEKEEKEKDSSENNSKKKEPPKVVQRVSNYDLPKKPKPPKGKAVTIILILLLLFLLGALAAVILFKDELVRFFNSFFS
jgi:archaellum component FlaD/FlaE